MKQKNIALFYASSFLQGLVFYAPVAALYRQAFGISDALGAGGLLTASAVFSLFLRGNDTLAALLTVISYGLAVFPLLFSTEVENPVENSVPLSLRIREIASAAGRDRSFLLFLFACALLAECSQTVTVFLSQLQYARAGVEPRAMGWFYLLVTAAGLLAARTDPLARRLGETRLFVLLFFISGAACLLLARFSAPALSVFCIMLLRAAAALAAPAGAQVQNRRVSVRGRAAMLSFYSVVQSGTGVLTNLAFGRFAQAGTEQAMRFGAVLYAGALALFLLWMRLDRPAARREAR